MSHEDLTKEQGAFVDRYFEENVYPVLTPMAVDSSRPFPLIRNKSLNIGGPDCEKRRRRGRTGFRHGAGSVGAAADLVHLPDGKRRREAV